MTILNQKGNLIIGVLVVILILLLIPFLITSFIPGADLVLKVVLIFSIYSFVTQMMQGNGTLTLLITGILVYFMVFKYGDLFASLWFVATVFTLVGGTLIVTSARDFLGFGQEEGGHGETHHPPH
ncbi:MAG: hypothetical protein V1776_02905 [Candidatus Diapherotrites archaeon]